MSTHLRELTPCSGDHVVHFYDDDAGLAWTVGDFLIDAARAGSVSIVIATEHHRRLFQDELEAAGIDVHQAYEDGTLIVLDAAETMAGFVSEDGRVDADGFDQVIGSLMRGTARHGRPVSAYGEMVALLWEAGNVFGAIELEKLWNGLGRELDFTLLCAYRSSSASGSGQADALQEVCRLHSAIIGGDQRVEEFAAEHRAPADARAFLTGTLEAWGYSGPLLDDARLVISELATNAVMHAGSAFRVVAQSHNGRLRLAVRDGSCAEPKIGKDWPSAPNGRGMRLVEAVCTRWGVEREPDGKTVWAELAS
jgi:anti-sigma regulatory factor (Ser/Thr protein kinase)